MHGHYLYFLAVSWCQEQALAQDHSIRLASTKKTKVTLDISENTLTLMTGGIGTKEPGRVRGEGGGGSCCSSEVTLNY